LPERVVYISCNPETQQRDLFFLVKNGYKVRRIQPVDMFPHTKHVETVVLIQRNISGFEEKRLWNTNLKI
jgi:23S rRNA (uracil1939-C5)-methyltransferase